MKYIIHAVEETDFDRLEIEADSKEEAIKIYNQMWSDDKIVSIEYNGNIRYVVKAINSRFKCDNSYCRKIATKIVDCPSTSYPNYPERYYFCDLHAKNAETRDGATSKPK